MRTQNCRKTVVKDTMKNANAKFASTKSTAISDAMMAAVLANSNWAKMESEARMFPLIPEGSLWEIRNSPPE
jgi:hypothetical protein